MLLWMLAASLVGGVALFFVFPGAGPAHTAALGERPRIQWLPPQGAQPSASGKLPYVIAETLDPSLMSLPSARGFSQPMWKRSAAAARRASDWNREPVYLDARAPQAFPALLNPPSLSDVAQSATQKLAPQPAEEAGEEPVESPVAVNQSVFRISGPLETRPIVQSPQLSTIASETPLRPTRVRAAVAADGVVRYAVLERSCGSEAVDARALELTKQMRFEPLGAVDSQPLMWGVVRFLWATEPPPAATNGNTNNK